MQYLKSEIRDKILCSAIEEFKTYGFADAAIRNIANNAEISLGNIYRYFTNKEALYFAIVNPFIEAIDVFIDKEVMFKDRTMHDLAEAVLSFVMQYSNELMIIRKGNTVHYHRFISHMVDAMSSKIDELLTSALPSISSKLTNPEFSDVISESFLTALFKTLRSDATIEVQERHTREILTFFFGQLKYRFDNFDQGI